MDVEKRTMLHNQGMPFWNSNNNCRTSATAGVDDLGGITEGFNMAPAPDFDASLTGFTFDLGCGNIYNMR